MLALLNGVSFAQKSYTIQGSVRNKKGIPIESATVFLESSIHATKTSLTGEFTLNNLKPGTYNLIVSALGYSASNEPVIIRAQSTTKDFVLDESIVQLEEVSIGNDSKRKEHLELFFNIFIGRSENAASCKILNPEVIEFSTNGTQLKASSKDFIWIENQNLGYRIKYLIRDFRFDSKSQITVYEGASVFEKLPGSIKQEKKWSKNRLLTYK